MTRRCPNEMCGGSLTLVEATDDFGYAKTSYYVCVDCGRRVEAGQ